MPYKLTSNNDGTYTAIDIEFGWQIELDKTSMRRIRSIGEPKTHDRIIREGIVIALRNVARIIGYTTLERGQVAIRHDLNKLYTTPEKLGAWVLPYARGRKDFPVWEALSKGDLKPYRKYMKNRGRRILAPTKEINPEEIRLNHKRRSSARRIKGFITPARERKYMRDEGDRVGVIGGGVFWDAAKAINPKARPEGMPRIKTKAQRKTRRSEKHTENITCTMRDIVAEVVGMHDNMRDVHDIDRVIDGACANAESIVRREITIKALQEDRVAAKG